MLRRVNLRWAEALGLRRSDLAGRMGAFGAELGSRGEFGSAVGARAHLGRGALLAKLRSATVLMLALRTFHRKSLFG